MPLSEEDKTRLTPQMAKLFKQPGEAESAVRIASDVIDGKSPATDEDKSLLTLMIQYAFPQDVKGEEFLNALLGRDPVQELGFSVDFGLKMVAAAAQYRLGLAITGTPGPAIVRRIIPMLSEIANATN